MTITGDPAMTGRLRLFVSYAREDRQGVQVLIEGVERLRHEIWVDKELSGGQAWWNEILTRIRKSDALLIAVSPRLLGSEASALERQYAQKLGKPLLPVVIRPILSHLLPPDLAPLHFVDYSNPGPMAAFELAGALASIPASPPLPDPLPSPPVVPISYLSDLTARVYAASLTLDEQLTLVAKLRTALQKAEEREAALELLHALQRRRDLYHAAARDVESAIPQQTSARSPSSAPHRTDATAGEQGEEESAEFAASAVPPGWYADPSSRHELRWFDMDWTSWVSDWGTVTEDPLV